MKIIQIGSYPLNPTLIKGGVEASVYGISVELSKFNELVVIDIPKHEIKADSCEQLDSIKVYRFYSKNMKNSASIIRLNEIVSIIKTNKPDICHIHTTGLFSLLIYVLLRLNKIPTIVTVHGLLHIEKQNVWRKKHSLQNLSRYLIQSATEFIFLSLTSKVIVDTKYVENAIHKYKKQGKIFRQPICDVIPQGINSIFFTLESQPQINTLLSVGAINKRKGYLSLIAAMEIVISKCPEVKLAILGIDSDRKYYGAVQQSIIDKGLEKSIEIYPNAPFDKVLMFYANSEIFVLHSEEESQGIVFCEAMAAGKAIVATNVGGIPWVVKNNVNGLLSDYGDIDTFANHIITLLRDKDIRLKMENTNKTQSLKYDWKVIANQIVEVYKSLITKT